MHRQLWSTGMGTYNPRLSGNRRAERPVDEEDNESVISPWWLLVEGVYFALCGALFFAAYKSSNEWVRATLAAFALSIVAWRVLAVIPSWWLYYAEGKLQWGGQGCINLDLSCLKQTIKDTVVVIQNAVALGGFVVAFWLYQRKFPKHLGTGESKPEATGGYK